MALSFLYVLCGLALLPLGAEWLVRGSTKLALRIGVSALAVGLTVVAFGTGSPELALSIEAARAGNGSIVLGNIIGSNISNVCLVLGVAAIARPMTVRSELIRREMPIMIAVTIVFCAMLLDGIIGRVEGSVLLLGAITYTIAAYQAAAHGESAPVDAEFVEALPAPSRSVWKDVVVMAIGLVLLLTGAQLLLKGAVAVAGALGVSQVVIGLTIVAVGTSLPELATSVAAAIRREPDVAFGNVIGSNVLNILAVVGVAALIHPLAVQGLRTLDLVAIVGTAALLLPMMWRGSILNRWEGIILLACYVAYLLSLFL